MTAMARLTLLGCLLLAGAAQAQYLDTLGTTPMSRFNAADNKLFAATLDKALAEGTEGEALAWKNDRSPAAGSITPQKIYVAKGANCRDLLIVNSYKTLKGEGVHTFCQNSAGKWKLVQ